MRQKFFAVVTRRSVDDSVFAFTLRRAVAVALHRAVHGPIPTAF